MKLINGKLIAKKILSEIKEGVSKMSTPPGLAIILVGSDPASHLYVKIKERACKKVGINFEKYLFISSSRETEIIEKIHILNKRSDIHGIVVQLPLPGRLNENKIIAEIDPTKNADGFHPKNTELLLTGDLMVVPALAQSVLHLLHDTGVDLKRKKALVIGRSSVFYNFLANVLLKEGIVSDFASPVTGLALSSQADIVIVAVGQPKYLMAGHVKDGAIVIDIGINETEKGVVGDADRQSLDSMSGYLSPVPGGVGPLTVVSLLKNILESAEKKTPK
ncbi:bifunctional 5,10-methylenetetrahydrofolate dehydrogenase/5,10-methenyltetrahydrofolate cyclohydrolase [Patescibacteria group bacterium]|nr:bifunctional 5,10-methylenetetrahydrofolate dehydrogenase/5,10-methenyltetrahydrofolate cyclohydrolase [Patescibacteria group bacterium]